MRDRRFWALALGIFPLLLVLAWAWPLFARAVIPPGALVVVALAAEAAALSRCVEPAVTADGARARRVAFGVAVSVVAGLLLGAALLMVTLMVAYGDGNGA